MIRVIIILSIFLGVLLKAEVSKCLLPTPKEVKVTGKVIIKNKSFTIVNNFGNELKEEQINLFSQTLAKRLNLKEAKSSQYKILLTKKSFKVKSKEYYQLEISNNGITISAAYKDGIFRGISRLLGMTLTPLVEFAGNNVVLPKMVVKDYPDNNLRIFQVNLRQVYKHTPKKLMMETALMLIDRACEMQFNCVMLMIGGNLKLAGHPEINPPGPLWTKDEIKQLVNRCKLRGVATGPMINSIGHAAAGPYVCPIYDKSGKKVLGINVTDPKFDGLFFRYIDELASLFPESSYFSIGTDEFHRVLKQIETLSGKKCEEYYPEYVNKVNRHLKKFKMQTVIYHDMLGPGGRYKWPIETLNGPKGAIKMLEKFDKDVIVAYWNYFHAYDYPFIKDLKAAKFKTIWFTGWYGHHGIRELYKLGNKLKSPLFTTQWSAIPAKNEFVHGAEFSWNVNSSKTQDDFNDINNYLFYRRKAGQEPVRNFEIAKLQGGIPLFKEYQEKLQKRFGKQPSVLANGIPMNFSQGRNFAPLRKVEEVSWSKIEELAKNKQLKSYTFYTPNTIVKRVIGSKSGVNEKREKQKVIFYTPKQGLSTNTNNRGVEFSINNQGKVLELSGNCYGKSGDEKGNMTIPKDGLVISWHEAQPCFFFRSYSFYQTLKANDTLILGKRSNLQMTKKVIKGTFTKPKSSAVVFISAVKSLEPSRILRITFTLANGKSQIVNVLGNDFISAPNILNENPKWNTYLPFAMVRYKLFPILAIELDENATNSKIVSVSIQASTAALESGVNVLGITGFDRKAI